MWVVQEVKAGHHTAQHDWGKQKHLYPRK